VRRWAAFAAAGAALAASGCAGARWGYGSPSRGYRVRAQGATLEQARRAAVSQLFDLFLSTEAQASSAGVLDSEVLSKAGSYILEERSRERRGVVSLSAEVAWARLGRTLDELGLVRARAFADRPTLSLRLSGDGSQAAAEAALRRRLSQLGYRFVDSGAAVALTGEATAAVPQGALDGFSGARVTLKVVAKTPDGQEAASVEQPGGAVEAKASDAVAKAMDSAGSLAADGLQALLAPRFKEAAPYTVTVLGLGDMQRARQWLAALRALPEVACASLDAVSDDDVRVRLYARGLGLDELTARLLRLDDFKLRVRGVEPDFSEIELAGGDSY
jgi:hypothetical protein